MSRKILLICAFLLFGLLLAACTPQTVEVTRIIEVLTTPQVETIEVEVTRIVEGESVTEMMEVTRIVEVPVEVEVDRGREGMPALNREVSGEVEFWHFWGSPVRRNAVRRVVAICEQELPNVRVTETFKPWGDIWTANVAAVAAGSGMPDVIVEDRPQLPQRAADQVVASLQPYIDRDNLDTSVFWDFTWDETLYEGGSYGVPFETDVRVLYWNKGAFEAVGLDPNRPPMTWEDLETYADALDVQRADGTYERIGFMPLWNAGPDFWAYVNGWEQVVDGTPNYDDPAFIEALEWIKGWIDRYGGWQNVQNFRATYGAAPNDLFMSGAVAIFVDVAGYSSQLNFYRPTPQIPADEQRVRLDPGTGWDISHIPYNVEPANWSGGFALSIPRGARNPDAAWEFIKCASSHIGQSSWARDTYAIPTNRLSATTPELMSDPVWQKVMEIMEHSQGSVYVPSYPNFGQEINQRLEAVWTGQMTAEEAAREAQEAIERTMQQNQ
jgi:multiple sugar transport system substrate-binding protein